MLHIARQNGNITSVFPRHATFINRIAPIRLGRILHQMMYRRTAPACIVVINDIIMYQRPCMEQFNSRGRRYRHRHSFFTSEAPACHKQHSRPQPFCPPVDITRNRIIDVPRIIIFNRIACLYVFKDLLAFLLKERNQFITQVQYPP